MKPAFSLILILAVLFVPFGASRAQSHLKANAVPHYTYTVNNNGDAPDADLADLFATRFR